MSVNLAVPETSHAKTAGVTGINKCPVDGPVLVRPPGPRAVGLGSGLVGDQILDVDHHSGDDQSVYAYAPVGVDVNGAVIGERWQVGAELLLQASYGRIPCATFQARMREPQWIKRFTRHARPGAYFRVVQPGEIRAGDEIAIVHRPGHGVTISEAFRAWTLEPELLPRLLDADEAPEGLKEKARQRLGIDAAR